MITPKRVFVISMAFFGAYCVARANAANSPGALSQYGQIQAVKNYSSNPYWNPNSPYNQKAIPKAIYVTGADLTTEDCNRIVDGLVSDLCSLNNNCSNMRLADVRPTIMVQLSQLPGHNYATACSGYIDAAFDKYVQTSITITAPLTTNTTTNRYTFQNPYAPKLNAYQAGVLERTKELEQLQAQTAASAQINSADFPKTVADLSFTDRMANAAEGYEPYKDKSAYKIPNFETEEDFNARTTASYGVGGPDEEIVLNQPKGPRPPCPDPEHMDNKCNCIAVGASKNKQGLCECTDKTKQLILNKCQTVEQAIEQIVEEQERKTTSFLIADCKARKLVKHLLPKRQAGTVTIKSKGDTLSTYCINRDDGSVTGSKCITNCIMSQYDEQQGGALSNFFELKTQTSMCRLGNSQNLVTNGGTDELFVMPEKTMHEFIESVGTDPNVATYNLQSNCKRPDSRTDWVLIIDKLLPSGASIPYATVCLGGTNCKTGEVTWHAGEQGYQP
ncbi:MAG: hypothetical protein J5611_01515 [Alphaproteobacteria bacterium]|nr:hypothetical protein [Alphaproteobacteria bacterium]